METRYSLPTDNLRKRSRSCSPSAVQRPSKGLRRGHVKSRGDSNPGQDEELQERKMQENFVREQTKLNQIQEAEQMREWVSKEDDFVLKQSKKKAQIRVREGRAKPIDWLTVILSVVDPTRDLLEDDAVDSELDIMDPAGVVEELDYGQLQDMVKSIESFIALESNPSNRIYWKAMKVICQERLKIMAPTRQSGRVMSSVSTDVDRLLSPKTLAELTILENQVLKKLDSNEPIDVEYWEQLLGNLSVYKAKAELRNFYKAVIDSRLQELKDQQVEEAKLVKEKLALLSDGEDLILSQGPGDLGTQKSPRSKSGMTVLYSRSLDPEPLLKIRPNDKVLEVIEEEAFLGKIETERRRILKMGYVPMRQRQLEKNASVIPGKAPGNPAASLSRFAAVPNEDFSSATTALYEREVARGVQEDEEIFAGEEEVSTLSKPQWANKYRPRKPRYFNRVQMGYEWNKYNQTHYDHDNPPPKVVQGYKFNIFYPDLIDKVKAPTYRIERENGRKRGQSFAPAGEEDTCLIRFISGPPYEDLAFRIVDKEWDYSAKRERGFRSSFEKGILQLHFQFKKVYYRK